MSTPTLIEFLLARIAEDEEMANRSIQIGDTGASLLAFGQPDAPPAMVIHPARVLAECEAKRRIVDWAAPVTSSERVPTARRGVYDRVPVRYISEDAEDLLRPLALPYADHPDYREEWKP